MARILETKGFKINLDNPDKKEVEKLKKANPELYAEVFEGKKRERKKEVEVEVEVEVEKPKQKPKQKTETSEE